MKRKSKKGKRPLSTEAHLRREVSGLMAQINARDSIIIALMQMLDQCHWDGVDEKTGEIVKQKILKLEV